jgi:hypothetical protein
VWQFIKRDKKWLNWKNKNLKKPKRWNKCSWFTKNKVTIIIIRIKKPNRKAIIKAKK